MSSTQPSPHDTVPAPPATFTQKLKFIGPGVIVAASGVGAGDFVMATLAGSRFGWALIWAVVAGAFMKLVLTEGIGRWYLSTQKTFLQGWHSLGWWATGYIGIYLVLFGVIYGAAEPAISALIMTAMFPGSPFWLWAVLSGLAGFVVVWFGKYELLEKLMMAFIALMFVTVVGSAVLVLANLGQVSYSLTPSVPEGSFVTTLAVIGGVGGTIGVTCYSYWVAAKGWRSKAWVPMMRTDITTAYVLTALFAVAVLIVGAELMFGTGTAIDGNEGLVELADTYGQRFGEVARWILLLGIWAAVFTSIVGPWHGISYLFADFVRIVRHRGHDVGSEEVSEKSPSFRAYLVWMTFPPMLLIFLGKPVAVVLVYGVLGAIFMPILAVGLMIMLNSDRVTREYRNTVFSNLVMGLIVCLFVYLGGREVIEMF